MHEFAIIENYFNKLQQAERDDVNLGIGDDCAIVQVPEDQQLLISTDTLVTDVHFFQDQTPSSIGHKSLAVNLSDLAAMGAKPCWVMLSLTLPEFDAKWLEGFCSGFFNLAQQYHCQLIGGDMSHGPLSITCQVFGTVPKNAAVLRSGAKPGDHIYVTGCLGDAALALDFIQTQQECSTELEDSLYMPIPRIAQGLLIREYATSMLDLSDGLAQDLGHILKASQVGATLYSEQIPLSAHLKNLPDQQQALKYALTGGDDYELCFTVADAKVTEFIDFGFKHNLPVTAIGKIVAEPGLRILTADHKDLDLDKSGYQHF